ncbi:hypothetical protein GGR56DRAFT_684802 [Xylariaceae sp. FL0804]|nr:hypothetical protein GGR56DRAFT_684802 [Xylariaceae sp. FL0804]
MDWLEYGTLGDFIQKAKSMGVKRLPNRLLWRFFLCLVRSCIAMAWPMKRKDNQVLSERVPANWAEQLAASHLQHNDLHVGNVLLDNPPLDEEHNIAPILKMIDFGLAGNWYSGNPGSVTGIQGNLIDIGTAMVALITLSPRPAVRSPGGPAPAGRVAPAVDTDALQLLPVEEHDGLDAELARWVCLCMATEHRHRPSLPDLSDAIETALRERTAEWYANRGISGEADSLIDALWHQILNYAPPAEVVSLISS